MSITTKLEKNAFYPGVVEVTASSNSWRVMQDTYIVKTEFVLASGAAGAGQTTINVIKNGDSNNVVSAASFSAGSASVLTNSTSFSLSAGDTLQVVVPEVAETPGEDLLVQFLYHN